MGRDHRRHFGRTAKARAHGFAAAPRLCEALAARSKPSIISVSGNSLATRTRAALPIVSRVSSLKSIPATVAAVDAESSGGYNAPLIPLAMYFKNGMVKVELGIAHGKQHHDKRRAIREKEEARDLRRQMSKRM